MSLAAALALLFFAPLSLVYARHVAPALHRTARARGRSVPAVALGRLVLAALLVLALGVAIPGREAFLAALPPSLAGQGAARLVLLVLDKVGGLALILFFLSVPYVLGSLVGVGAAMAGRWTTPPGRVDADASGPQTAADDDLQGRPVAGHPPSASSSSSRSAPRRGSRLTIAIDGPAAAGKGTLAQRLAAHYGLPYLDTGLLYRAVGRLAAARFVDPDDAAATAEIARRLDTAILDDGALRGREAGELASRVAVHPEVRAALEAFQRDFARQPDGAVLDGRDIGTVICPDADVKIFVTASPEVRARRRTDELLAKGREATYERILAEVRERDARDAGRAVAPLRAADDAHLLDTSEMDIETAFQAACGLIDRSLAARDGV